MVRSAASELNFCILSSFLFALCGYGRLEQPPYQHFLGFERVDVSPRVVEAASEARTRLTSVYSSLGGARLMNGRLWVPSTDLSCDRRGIFLLAPWCEAIKRLSTSARCVAFTGTEGENQ